VRRERGDEDEMARWGAVELTHRVESNSKRNYIRGAQEEDQQVQSCVFPPLRKLSLEKTISRFVPRPR
jgi:hypothetical protein